LNSKPSQLILCNQDDLQYQARILPGVSRTFAMTIPVLPHSLSPVVANAYLLCRIADTIEDDIFLDATQKSRFHQHFISVVEGRSDARAFSSELGPLLSEETLPDERSLIENSSKIIRITNGFSIREQQALQSCIKTMCTGMPEFQRIKSLAGLKDLEQLYEYCYIVAGVVGEMLTELFCIHCAELEKKRNEMMELAVAFGKGLQMTNILKDMWNDRELGACWVPRSVFSKNKAEMKVLDQYQNSQAYLDGMNKLISIACGNVRQGLEYTCEIPTQELGIRRFCVWALSFAVLTLRKIHANPSYTSAEQVKISRRTVEAATFASNIVLGSNKALRLVFDSFASKLQLTSKDID